MYDDDDVSWAVTDLLPTFYIAANKEYLTKIKKYFQICKLSIPSAIVWNFSLNWLTFLEAIKKIKIVLLFVHSAIIIRQQLLSATGCHMHYKLKFQILLQVFNIIRQMLQYLGALVMRHSGLYFVHLNGSNDLYDATPGQLNSVGVPSVRNINSNWLSTAEPGNNGLPDAISKSTHPTPLQQTTKFVFLLTALR